jgi:hypothetical protein
VKQLVVIIVIIIGLFIYGMATTMESAGQLIYLLIKVLELPEGLIKCGE